MAIPVNIYSAFSNKAHECLGNPCAVIQLEEFLSDSKLQKIAATIHYPATAFLTQNNNDSHNSYTVRWFAPDAEIDLCGHGAMASCYHLFNQENLNEINLVTKSGYKIKGSNNKEYQTLILEPIAHESSSPAPKGLEAALGTEIISYHVTQNKHIVVLKNEEAVAQMIPDFKALKNIDVFGYAVTAPSKDSNIDFVSRTLVPHVHQLEDYATGSSHLALFPFWRKALNKNFLKAKQLSFRGGLFHGQFENNLFKLGGESSHILNGTLLIE